jgi:dihydrofolate reductase
MEGTRKLIVCNAMSLDGYYEGPDKNVMDLFDYRFEAYPADESFDAYNAERLRAADTLLLGRTSYNGFKGFWPPVADDSDAQAHPEGDIAAQQRHRQGGRIGRSDP